ncbi:MAG: sensor histidine kinase [Anaerolineae bacterium]|jgi:two-component system sensor histidine kinase DegS|nr:sensor histidine kinase [Anaerolineae bacterium]
MVETNWDQFTDFCRAGSDQIQRELKEIDMLIQQTVGEVDRLMQANARAVSRLRQVESSFDTIPREDIRKGYDTLVENQQRLFTMRGQLEKLQSDQRNLSRLAELYTKVLSFAPPEAIAEPGTAVDNDKDTTQAMVINIIEAQEQERLRLSRQMHDGPAQSLTNLVLQAEICERLFDRDPERARHELGELKRSVVNAFKSVKVFIFDLRPMMLDDLGLIPTIRRYVSGITDEGFTGLTLSVTGKDRRLAPHKEVTIFRVIQALIHLAREQDQASSISVHLNIEDDEVRVAMEDNGIGFEIDEALASADAARLNLSTLRERIEMLNGSIHFTSAPGKGLRVSFQLPIEQHWD